MVVTSIDGSSHEYLRQKVAELRQQYQVEEIVTRAWPTIEAQLEETGHTSKEELLAAMVAAICLLDCLTNDLSKVPPVLG